VNAVELTYSWCLSCIFKLEASTGERRLAHENIPDQKLDAVFTWTVHISVSKHAHLTK